MRNVVGFGMTTAPTTSADGVAQQQVQLFSGETPTLLLAEMHGFAGNLPENTPVTAVFAAGDRSNGVIIASSAPGSRPAMAGASDKAMFAYGFFIMIQADGVHITAPKLFIQGDVEVTGKLQATGEITAGFGTADQVTVTQHKHPEDNTPPTPGT